METLLSAVTAVSVCVLAWEITSGYRRQAANWGGPVRLRLRGPSGQTWRAVGEALLGFVVGYAVAEIAAAMLSRQPAFGVHATSVFVAVLFLGAAVIRQMGRQQAGEIREQGLVYWRPARRFGGKRRPVFAPWRAIRGWRWGSLPGEMVIELPNATRSLRVAPWQVPTVTSCLEHLGAVGLGSEPRQDSPRAVGAVASTWREEDGEGETPLRGFQFTLRALFVLLLGASCALSWYELQRLGGLSAMLALRRLQALGPVTKVFDAPMILLFVEPQSSPRSVSLDFSACPNQPHDEDLEPLRRLPRLHWLRLAGTPITDATLAYLQDLPGLYELDLSDTRVTDAGLAYLKRNQTLQVLYLDGTSITDQGLEHLKSLRYLARINLWNTKVTTAGLEGLRAVLPDLRLSNEEILDPANSFERRRRSVIGQGTGWINM